MIKAIFIAKDILGPQEQVESIELTAGKGIVGDRNFNRTHKPGKNITFVEIEQIERYNNDNNQNIKLSATRRNVVTEGIRLNELVGKNFTIGPVKFRGIELCEPCATLGGQLENENFNKAQVVKALAHKGGLRADVINDGNISTGMTINID
jgi:MOSC domain-containing protein YiiM